MKEDFSFIPAYTTIHTYLDGVFESDGVTPATNFLEELANYFIEKEYIFHAPNEPNNTYLERVSNALLSVNEELIFTPHGKDIPLFYELTSPSCPKDKVEDFFYNPENIVYVAAFFARISYLEYHRFLHTEDIVVGYARFANIYLDLIFSGNRIFASKGYTHVYTSGAALEIYNTIRHTAFR